MIYAKCDINAKAAFVAQLEKEGFENIKVVSLPCDITAEKDDKTWYFEIKINNFGEYSINKLKESFKETENFKLVIATPDESQEGGFNFTQYTLEEYIEKT